MIGDWVDFYHPYEPEKKNVTRHRVTEIFECGLVGISNHINPVHADHIEPVKITPEILEKNGFVTNDEQGNWKGYRMYSLFDTNKSCIFMLKLYEKDSIGEISLDMSPYYIVFKFVHQLQHALRLCGIDKTIEL